VGPLDVMGKAHFFLGEVGLYTLNAVDPWLESHLVSTLEPIK
jgi:hypothetical protein